VDDSIGQATVINGDKIKRAASFGFWLSTLQRPANPGSGSVGKFDEYP
jgi:hypothetical protein